MSIASVVRKHPPRPPIITLYGVPGIGKTTFASMAPNPVFIRTEDGLGLLDVAAFPVAKSYADVKSNIISLLEEKHDFETVVIDSVDWLETLIWQQVAVDKKVGSIEDIGYGKGLLFALDYWKEYLDLLNYLRDEKGMTVIQLAHSVVKPFNNPEGDNYDRYAMKLHTKDNGKSASSLVQEHSDMVLFANYNTIIKAEDKGKGKAVGGDRFLFTSEKPAYHAKNRYSLPEKIKFDENAWDTLSSFIPSLSKK